MTEPASAEVKAEALAIYREHGPAEAARQTGVKRGTISQWARRAGVTCDSAKTMAAARDVARKVWDRNRLVEADEAGQEAAYLRSKVHELAEAGKAQDCRAMAVAYAILIDKAQLLSGDVTGRQAFSQVPDQPKELPATPADVVAEGRQRALQLVMPRASESE